MASGDCWPQTWTSGGSGGRYVISTTGSSASWTMPVTYYSGGGTYPAPRPQTALEWLDAEIERTCKLARGAA